MPIMNIADVDADGVGDKSRRAVMVDKLAHLYHSDYVAKNEPWVREIPFHEWLNRKLIAKGFETRD